MGRLIFTTNCSVIVIFNWILHSVSDSENEQNMDLYVFSKIVSFRFRNYSKLEINSEQVGAELSQA